MQDISKSIEACAAYYGDDAAAVRDYLIEGQKRALALPNRGPLRFMDNGDIHSDILEAYSTYGFYIFENALRQEELKDLENDLAAMRDNFPTEMGAPTDAKGLLIRQVAEKADRELPDAALRRTFARLPDYGVTTDDLAWLESCEL